MSRTASTQEIDLARELWPRAAWSGGVVEEVGDDHLVLVPDDDAPDVVLRLARRTEVGELLPSRMRLLTRLAPHLPWQLPVPLTEVEPARGTQPAAVVQRFVAGSPHPPHTGDPAVLRTVLEALAAVPPVVWEGHVSGPFRSTPRWDEAGCAAVLRVLPSADERRQATAVWESLTAVEGEERALVHGDLAGHNMHWQDGRLVGVLDWDHAAAWDPAINLAHLALWHGAQVIAPAAPGRRFADRAGLWVGHLALHRLRQAAANPAVRRWERLWRKTLPRLAVGAAAAERLLG